MLPFHLEGIPRASRLGCVDDTFDMLLRFLFRYRKILGSNETGARGGTGDSGDEKYAQMI